MPQKDICILFRPICTEPSHGNVRQLICSQEPFRCMDKEKQNEKKVQTEKDAVLLMQLVQVSTVQESTV